MRFDLVFLLIGISLVLVEFAIPGLYIISLGVGSLVASAFASLGYPPLDILLSFLVSGGGTAILARSFYSKFFPGPCEPNKVVGKKGEVISAQGRKAKVKIGRQQFLAKGRALEEGDEVEVTGKEETVLLVEKSK